MLAYWIYTWKLLSGPWQDRSGQDWRGHHRTVQGKTSALNECPPTMWWYNFKLKQSCDSILVSHPCVCWVPHRTTHNTLHNISWHTRTPSCNKLQKIIWTTKTWHFAKKLCVAWVLYFYVVLPDKSFRSGKWADGWKGERGADEKWKVKWDRASDNLI